MATKHQRFAELAVEAEQAVQGVKDPELRRIAYQKILEDLLGGTRPAGGARRSAGGTAAAAKKPEKATPAARKKGGTTVYLTELVNDQFFKKPKTIAHVKAELENRGHHIPITSLSGPLQTLCQRRILRRARIEGAYSYSNW